MHSPVNYICRDQSLWLSPDRCIFWEDQQALIVSDLHFGKTGHFRKSGIAVPQNVFKEDLQRLIHQLQFFNAKLLIAVGDLFHSQANKELELFTKWRKDLADVEIRLIKGNHDILKDKWYASSDILVIKDVLTIGNFCFQHDLKKCTPENGNGKLNYTFSGHIHPGIIINGLGKQSLRFPCFYFAKQYCVLPAFSHFTGVALIEPEDKESVFAIVNNSIISIQT